MRPAEINFPANLQRNNAAAGRTGAPIYREKEQARRAFP